MRSILENIQKGIEQGLYRLDINPTILARMRVEQIELAFNAEMFPTDQFSMHDIQAELIHHFVRGMLTEKGLPFTTSTLINTTMKLTNTRKVGLIWLLTLLGTAGPLLAQNKQEFSLNEAIKFGVDNNINVKNSGLDALSAEGRIQELRGVALPQVTASGQLTDNLIIQRVFLPAVFFDPKAAADASCGSGTVWGKLFEWFDGYAQSTSVRCVLSAGFKGG